MFRLYAQSNNNDQFKIIRAVNDTIHNVKVLPEKAFSDEYNLLITGFNSDLTKGENKNVIKIEWGSYYIDGFYMLVITPRQIYLRSGHNNPNQSFLYWLSDFSEKQFSLIKDFLEEDSQKSIIKSKSRNVKYLSYDFKKAIIEADISKKNPTTKNERYENLKRIIKLINKSIPNKIKIPSKKEFNNINTIRVIYHIDDLDIEMSALKRVKK